MPDPILTRARELIADEANWIQTLYSDGPIDDPHTKCFCTVGAVNRAVIEHRGWMGTFCDDNFAIAAAESDPSGAEALAKLQDILEDSADGSVADFNDAPDTTHADVLELIDRANA